MTFVGFTLIAKACLLSCMHSSIALVLVELGCWMQGVGKIIRSIATSGSSCNNPGK